MPSSGVSSEGLVATFMTVMTSLQVSTVMRKASFIDNCTSGFYLIGPGHDLKQTIYYITISSDQ